MGIEFEHSADALRACALEYLRAGKPGLAEHAFRNILEQDPNDVDALRFLAARHLERNERVAAIELFERAENVRPGHAATLHQLGMAYAVEGRLADAIAALGRCLEADENDFVGRLFLGVVLERHGQKQRALTQYFSAINRAQAKGYWLSDESTAPALRKTVVAAMRTLDAGRRELFHKLLEPLRGKYGAIALRRVEHALSIYLGERQPQWPDPRQKPLFLYFPDIPSLPYYPRERFPWIDSLEAGAAFIREELLNVLSHSHNLESFLQTDSPHDASELLRSSNSQDPAWDAYFFHRHGERFEEHCLKCPRTAGLLDTLPLAYVREHSPETLFSVLSPGTHILPHRGVTNTRLVTHLPLIVPADCALRVGGETHVWEEGRCVTFDDTFEHEAWNKSSETRVVLIVDSWNPDLSEAEREAVADLVGAIGDFNRASELPAAG
ncbi:aspartate beta-hydroxylase [Rhodanobacter sp. ANJX3]|uniref:aspartyl/asparaginyl beta-hydroxylase domain-containing protein n=1 Tax=Rhodanobacter sp. ANJX3 TaxID=2723083 RepID=UPI00161C6847|nr:aspartyl/asparaginyl beta-hydroxylase domain-containing protein [Rhodanobacter sp. ANJX3]MBB5359767.1 aspartate beta-hydroxylase [Rhodanobacter sp. ANJX3]